MRFVSRSVENVTLDRGRAYPSKALVHDLPLTMLIPYKLDICSWVSSPQSLGLFKQQFMHDYSIALKVQYYRYFSARVEGRDPHQPAGNVVHIHDQRSSLASFPCSRTSPSIGAKTAKWLVHSTSVKTTQVRPEIRQTLHLLFDENDVNHRKQSSAVSYRSDARIGCIEP